MHYLLHPKMFLLFLHCTILKTNRKPTRNGKYLSQVTREEAGLYKDSDRGKEKSHIEGAVNKSNSRKAALLILCATLKQ